MSEELLQAELKQLRDTVTRMDATLMQVRDKVLTMPQCPSPGACIPLAKQQADFEVRLRFLERTAWLGMGALALLQFALKYL